VRLLSTLLAGVVSNLLTDGDEDNREEKGGVILRREQVTLVLFDGKAGVIEDYFQEGKFNSTIKRFSS
jgi:AP-3 complex subunit beta